MEFFAGVAWCLSGWLAWRISQKLDEKKRYDWQEEFVGFIFGPFILIPIITEYLKQKKRAKYRPAEQLNKKDIYTLWD